MYRSSVSSHITPHVLKTLYEAIRRMKPIQNHPLLGLVMVQQRRLALNGTITYQQALFDVLIDHLTAEFDRLRELHHFSPANPNCSIHDAQTDLAKLGVCTNEWLLACSMIYYRYGRAELGFAKGEIANYLGYDDRSLRRFTNDFWQHLCWLITQAEYKAGEDARQLRCQLTLPRRKLIQLTDQEKTAQSFSSQLRQTDPACLMLYGSAGVGKSVMALRIAHYLIEQKAVNDVAWIDMARADLSPTPQNLTIDLCRELGLGIEPYPIASSTLTAYIYQRVAQDKHILIILDGASEWELAIQALWRVLCHCTLIVTTRRRFRFWYGLSRACPTLSKADANAILQFWDEDRRFSDGWTVDEEIRERFVRLGRGNLSRLKCGYERWLRLHIHFNP